MEIERKWIVDGFPEGLPEVRTQYMEQGYVVTHPTVRIRKEADAGGETEWILCFKSSGTLSRKEIEISVPEEKYLELADLIGKPLIPKLRKTYALKDGLFLEVNEVDIEAPTGYYYAEIEYPDEEKARAWRPEPDGLAEYLRREVTELPGETMGAYWERTRNGRQR